MHPRALLAGLVAIATMTAMADDQQQAGDGAQDRPLAEGEDIALLVPVTAVTNKRTYSPLEPVSLSIGIRNDSRARILLENNHNKYQNFNILVYTKQGREVSRTEYSRSLGGGMSGYENCLLPGETSRVRLAANLVADMTAQGEYTIVVEVKAWAQFMTGPPRATLRSKPVKVKVSGWPVGDEEKI